MHEIKVDFRIVGFDCSADEITKQVGISPSKVLLKDDIISGQATRKRKENVWILESNSDNETDLDAHLQNLAEKIKPHLGQLKSICDKYYCEFACRLYLQNDSDRSIPSVHLDKSFIGLLQKLNVELDLDIYTG